MKKEEKKMHLVCNQVLYHTSLGGGEIDYIHLDAPNKWCFPRQLFMLDLYTIYAYTDDHRSIYLYTFIDLA